MFASGCRIAPPLKIIVSCPAAFIEFEPACSDGLAPYGAGVITLEGGRFFRYKKI